jgi:DNA processing protein
MTGPDMERVARAYLLATCLPGDEEVARRVAAVGPVLVAQETAAAAGNRWMQAGTMLAGAETAGIRLLAPDDDEWPECLSAALLTDGRITAAAPPLALWVRGGGRLDRLSARAVCVAGAVEATPYGEKAAFGLGQELAGAGWTVITSGAFGVSSAVIRGVLAAGGPVLVLPTAPLTTTVPAGHRLLLGRVAGDGLLLTECVPGLAAHESAAIRQTQLAVALAAAVVLIEPRPRGLDRRLVHLTHHAGRPVLAYPGPVAARSSAYAHHLIRAERARLVASPQHVLSDLEWRSRVDAHEPG